MHIHIYIYSIHNLYTSWGLMLSENSLHADIHIIIIDEQLEMNNKTALQVYFTYKTKAFPVPYPHRIPVHHRVKISIDKAWIRFISFGSDNCI